MNAILKRLFPDGTRLDAAEGDFTLCPSWPPDAFAAAAMLTELSGLYTQPAFTAGWDDKACVFTAATSREAQSLGKDWAADGDPPGRVQDLWTSLIAAGDAVVGVPEGGVEDWHIAAMRLLAIADEASRGVGFAIPSAGRRRSVIARLVMKALQEYEDGSKPTLPHVPRSLCHMIAPTECCVQPKTGTPTVGCTLRSLSHHLALLPPIGVVETHWLFGHTAAERAQKPLNLLLVPFPYIVRGLNFKPAPGRPLDSENRFFAVDAGWLKHNGSPVEAATIAGFLSRLIADAKKEVGEIHGVVLPECALSEDLIEPVATTLAKDCHDLEFLISGGTADDTGQGQPTNAAFIARVHKKTLLRGWRQDKHHRWRVDRGQIARYHLGHVLDPDCCWWEKIDIRERACAVSVVRHGASLAVLVCEDLARFDPVLPAINAIGPTLVVALLMDGPQMERRWPGRYATVLADDPGSSVLTLSCLGMIRRSTMPGEPECRQIALWKEPGGVAQELSLPHGDHALLLSLTSTSETQTTLDLRKDVGGTQRLRLTAVRGVRLPRDEQGNWPDLG